LLQLVFEDQNSSFTQSVTPSNNTLSFTVPNGVESGNIYLKNDDFETNKLYLSVKRNVDVHVGLSTGVNIESSEISFVLGLEEFTLDSEFKTTLVVENNSLDYIHAVIDNDDNTSSVLYTGVVLPNEAGTIEVDSSSTAVAWIFMGMGASVASEKENLQNLYTSVSSNTKVQAFASYIDELQKDNLSAWTSLSDTTLKEKYQEALQDVLENYSLIQSESKSLARSIENDPTAIKITQDPLNNEIYINDLSYDYLTYGSRLTNGSVSIVNDTKLYMSVEVKNAKDETIVNGYSHVDELMTMNHQSLVGPKGWALLGIASSKELEIQGKDSNIEIIIGSAIGTTDKQALSLALRSRVFIDGVGIPIINIFLKALMGQSVSAGLDSYKNVIEAMKAIYGPSFFVDLTTKVSSADNGYYAIADTLILTPLTNGYNSCFEVPIGGACEKTVNALAVLIWNNTNDAYQKFLISIATAAGAKIAKKAAAVIPVVGLIINAREGLDYLNNAVSIGESLYDMDNNPKEINVNVDFPLEVESVSPTCVGITPESITQNFNIKGEGFAEFNQLSPVVSISEGDTTVNMSGLTILDTEEMVAAFDAQTLLGSYTWSGDLAVEHLGQKITYDTPIRIVSSEDSNLYFDSVEPQMLIRGNIATLKGCGWIPVDSIEVEFTTTTGLAKANIVSKSINTIEVEIPLNAISGLLYVNTTNKSVVKSIEISEFGLSSTSKVEVADGDSLVVQGSGLADTAHLYFRDAKDNIVEGAMENITDTDIRVIVPGGLEIGILKLYAVLNDGTKSNELTLAKVPKSPEAAPSTGDINDGLEVTLSQDEGADIYYTLHDNDKDAAIKYTSPINLNTQDMIYAQEFIYTFARVTVDGVDYDSAVEMFTYNACSEGMELNADKECVVQTLDYLCPSTSPDGSPSVILGDESTGTFTQCIYEFDLSLIAEMPYVNDMIHGLYIEFYSSGPVYREAYWEEGYAHGSTKSYYESGNLNVSGQNLYGLREGAWLFYYEDGCLYREVTYENDIVVDSTYYDCP
jgi:hypothetical protein